jgi:hypothetical protein
MNAPSLTDRILRVWFREPRRRAFHLRPERLAALKALYGTDKVLCFHIPLTALEAK